MLIWYEPYMEELNGLIKLGTYEEISFTKYSSLCNEDAPKAIPFMCALSIKKDEMEQPVHAKSCGIIL
eukprot:14911908-Ditylum_brightwellii.AAC.2